YVLLDAAAYTLPAAPFAATPWNPHPALAVVLVIDGGLWYAPAVFAAVALAEVLGREAPRTLLGTASACAGMAGGGRCWGGCRAQARSRAMVQRRRARCGTFCRRFRRRNACRRIAVCRRIPDRRHHRLRRSAARHGASLDRRPARAGGSCTAAPAAGSRRLAS